MTAIKHIPGILNEFKKIERDKGLDKVKSTKSSESSSKSDKTGKSFDPIDKVELSVTAKSLLKSVEGIPKYLEDLKSIRNASDDELQQINEKIETGYYDKPDVIDKIIEDILLAPAFKDIEMSGRTDASEEKLAQVEKDIQSGKYNSEAVLDVIVDKIIKTGE